MRNRRSVLWLLLGIATWALPACSGDPANPTGGSGLDARPANATCIAPDRPPFGQILGLIDAFPRLQPAFSAPLALVQAPEPDGRWFVIEQAGFIRVFEDTPDVSGWTTWADLRARVDDGPREAGLLGMALHPDFATNGQVILSYTANDGGLVSRISRFTESAGGTLDAGSEQILLSVDQPFGNHNGGHVAFGPDGLLYAGLGDGGSANDPGDRAQDNRLLLGSMLRIDVDAGFPYAIPAGNPFATNDPCPDGVGDAPCPEIYAYGLRNPWRWSFDRQTGELWLGDVGQGSWEEIDLIERNGNYGWRICEGAHLRGQVAPCDTPGLIDPVAEYDHTLGLSVTGGFVYRGDAIPALRGIYLYADYLSGRVWGLELPGDPVELLQSGMNIASFGQGNDGELYALDVSSGRIQRFVASGAAPPGDVATRLSLTGCADPADPRLPASGLIPYAVNAAFWSDGAQKERWLALPDGETVDVDAAGDWHLPPGSVLMKHFRLAGRLVETRLLMRHPDGNWAGYSYAWDDTETDATLLDERLDRIVEGQLWTHPSGADCLVCHSAAAGRSLGPETAQLNRDLTYPSTGRTANQLATLSAIGVTSAPLPDPAALPALPNPNDAEASTSARARALLHTNCAGCHRAGGPTPVGLDLRYPLPLAATGLCDPPEVGDLGLGGAHIVTPGDPDLSILRVRMALRNGNGMPPLGSNALDLAGLALIDDWIGGLATCP